MISLILQSAQEPASWVSMLERGGLLGGALAFIWALLTERIVPGTVYRRAVAEERARAEEWRVIAGERAIPLAEEAVKAARS